MTEIRGELASALDAALTDEALTALKNRMSSAIGSLQEDFEYALRTDLSYNLSRFAYRMAESAIEDILNGDDEMMRQHLHCMEGRYTGRGRDHSVIHGKLFETRAIELRKSIVNAHADLLKTERILDLEDQVKSLTEQVNKLDATRDRLQRELNEWTRE